MAVECNCDALIDGILKGCLTNSGGIRRVWLYNKCEVEIADSSPSGYKELTFLGSPAGKAYKFEFNRNTSTFTENKTGEPANGVEFYVQTLSIKLNRREKSKRAVLLTMGRFTELGGIVEDMNGLFWLLGEVDGLILTENNSENGISKTDHNGYNLTLVGEEDAPASEITAAHITTLIQAGSLDNE